MLGLVPILYFRSFLLPRANLYEERANLGKSGLLHIRQIR